MIDSDRSFDRSTGPQNNSSPPNPVLRPRLSEVTESSKARSPKAQRWWRHTKIVFCSLSVTSVTSVTSSSSSSSSSMPLTSTTIRQPFPVQCLCSGFSEFRVAISTTWTRPYLLTLSGGLRHLLDRLSCNEQRGIQDTLSSCRILMSLGPFFYVSFAHFGSSHLLGRCWVYPSPTKQWIFRLNLTVLSGHRRLKTPTENEEIVNWLSGRYTVGMRFVSHLSTASSESRKEHQQFKPFLGHDSGYAFHEL